MGRRAITSKLVYATAIPSGVDGTLPVPFLAVSLRTCSTVSFTSAMLIHRRGISQIFYGKRADEASLDQIYAVYLSIRVTSKLEIDIFL